jgi:hypothetical protein
MKQLTIIALTLLLVAGCGSGELTSERYIEIMTAVEAARAIGESIEDVYDEFGVTEDELAAFEETLEKDELTELTVELEEQVDEVALPMEEATYIELTVLVSRLVNDGVPGDEISERLDEELAAHDLTMNEWDKFAGYVAENPEVAARVQEAVEKR